MLKSPNGRLFLAPAEHLSPPLRICFILPRYCHSFSILMLLSATAPPWPATPLPRPMLRSYVSFSICRLPLISTDLPLASSPILEDANIKPDSFSSLAPSWVSMAAYHHAA